MSTAILPLRVEDTVEASHVNHRLALGMQWLDALMQHPASGLLVTDLEAIGSRPLGQRFDPHPQARHALRWAGRLAKILATAAQEKVTTPPVNPEDDPTNFALRCFALRSGLAGSYSIGGDPRRYVPRRLAVMPVQNDGVPTPATDNIRHAWLWPGAAYPLAANSTAVRGRIRRGASLDDAIPVQWARIVVTRPGPTPPDFASELQIGWGHGDDRGEFLVVLGAQAVPGGATLPQTMTLRVWVFLPPAAASSPAEPLAGLPLEQAGSDSINDVLRGIAPPVGYVRQPPADITLRPGEVFVMSDAVLLFP